jgi:hypothetical protein
MTVNWSVDNLDGLWSSIVDLIAARFACAVAFGRLPLLGRLVVRYRQNQCSCPFISQQTIEPGTDEH